MRNIFTKGIECILRAVLYPSSNIVLVCKDDTEAKKYMNKLRKLINENRIIQPEITETNNDGCILFKNGSYIKIIEKKGDDSNQPIRGKRFNKFLVIYKILLLLMKNLKVLLNHM